LAERRTKVALACRGVYAGGSGSEGAMYTQSVSSMMEKRKLMLVPRETSVLEAARRMAKRNYGAVLVVDGEALVGIFTERDLTFRVVARKLDPAHTPVAEVMTPEPRTIGAHESFGKAMLVMYEGGFRHLPVIDDGKVVGLVSSRMALDPELEEFTFESHRRRALLATP
jgi:CBS domain-containing protein